MYVSTFIYGVRKAVTNYIIKLNVIVVKHLLRIHSLYGSANVRLVKLHKSIISQKLNLDDRCNDALDVKLSLVAANDKHTICSTILPAERCGLILTAPVHRFATKPWQQARGANRIWLLALSAFFAR
jgi:ArsR family metal-binding transcriptional regulator